jgi:hypothetical protein
LPNRKLQQLIALPLSSFSSQTPTGKLAYLSNYQQPLSQNQWLTFIRDIDGPQLQALAIVAAIGKLRAENRLSDAMAVFQLLPKTTLAQIKMRAASLLSSLQASANLPVTYASEARSGWDIYVNAGSLPTAAQLLAMLDENPFEPAFLLLVDRFSRQKGDQALFERVSAIYALAPDQPEVLSAYVGQARALNLDAFADTALEKQRLRTANSAVIPVQ